jgi:hypothetical protein
VFYGVGQFANGAPNYPMQPMGTMSEGPSLTTLTAPLEIPWADTPDPFGDSNWNTAARLLSGTFAINKTPAFGAGNDANVFTSLPLTASGLGNIATATTITTIVRTNFVVPSADYNKNGIVDAADYIIWRKQDGTSVPPYTGADGTGDGMVNQADYTFWRSRFGMPFGAGSGADLSTTPVPEPTSVIFIAIAAILIVAGALRGPSAQRRKLATAPMPLDCQQPCPSKRIDFCANGRK